MQSKSFINSVAAAELVAKRNFFPEEDGYKYNIAILTVIYHARDAKAHRSGIVKRPRVYTL